MPAPAQVAFTPVDKPSIGRNGWQGVNPHTQYLKKGDRPFNARAIDCDITIDHDVIVTVRDGCRLYIDVYRPTNPDCSQHGGKVPAILSYSPFGKKYSGLLMLPITPYKMGVTSEDISGLEKFEGIDPAKWCAWGFAVISVDARGAGASDGSIPIMGTQEAEDGYDVIEAIAKMEWCNGSVGLAGNSHLAIVQWFIASLNPPSLKAIAPWEGCSDLYREQFVRGGIFSVSNFEFIIKHVIQGGSGVEDFREMYRRTDQGKINAFWADKRVDMKKIKVPTYTTAAEFSSIHTMGSVRGYLEVDTEDKWLRWAGWQEWHDLWAVEETNIELRDFFDCFLKGMDNGFRENTPKVRMTLLQFGKKEPIHNIVVEDFPIPNTDYKTLFLDPSGILVPTSPSTEGSVTWDSTKTGDMASFTLKFEKKTQLVGLPKAILHMSCDDSDDMCVFVQVRKLGPTGETLVHLTVPFARAPIDDAKDAPNNGLIAHHGALGALRASHRHIDASKSIHPQYPFHPHDRVEKVPKGTVVELEIGIWAMAVQFEAGESVRIDISGSNPLWPEVAGDEEPINTGRHKVWTGGKFGSRVILPFVEI